MREHEKRLETTNVEVILVKNEAQLKSVDGLILPSGEIYTIQKLMMSHSLFAGLKQFGKEGKPIFGTGAGLILMANTVVGEEISPLNFIDMTVEKNAIGSIRSSFKEELMVTGIGEDVPAIFIRSPRIVAVGEHVEILSKYNGEIVAVKQDQKVACTFHPELTRDDRFHQYFVEMVRKNIRY